MLLKIITTSLEVESLEHLSYLCFLYDSTGHSGVYIDWEDSELMSGLCSHHWLMESNLRNELIAEAWLCIGRLLWPPLVPKWCASDTGSSALWVMTRRNSKSPNLRIREADLVNSQVNPAYCQQRPKLPPVSQGGEEVGLMNS